MLTRSLLFPEGAVMAEQGENETVAEQVERLVAERLNQQKAEADRKSKLDKLGLSGDVLDAIADAVWDRGESRAEARRKAADDADQPPTTGPKKKSGGFLGLFPVESTGTDD